MKHAEAEFAKSKYSEISKAGIRFNLSFSIHWILGNKIIALDEMKKNLLVLETDTEENPPNLIDLNNVVAVTVRKSYGSIKQGELKRKGIEDFLRKIDLQFSSRNKSKTLVLPIYDRETDDQMDRLKLESDAKHWQLIISKIVRSQTDRQLMNAPG